MFLRDANLVGKTERKGSRYYKNLKARESDKVGTYGGLQSVDDISFLDVSANQVPGRLLYNYLVAGIMFYVLSVCVLLFIT